jgi:creatinine amidohydrolase
MSDHGGESETSRMLHLHPELVRTEKLQLLPVMRPFVEGLAQGKVFYVRPWHLHVPMAGGGETRKASAEKGRIIIDSSADGLADFLVELSRAPWNPDFPYAPEATRG